MDLHMEASNRIANGNKQETVMTQANVHTSRNSNSTQNSHFDTHTPVFKHCNKKEKSPSPCYDSRRDDMKYIDEESIGTFPSEVSMESSCSRKPSPMIPISPAGVPVGNAPIADKMIRSCSVGYLDVVHSQLVPCEVTLAMLRKEAPKRLVLVNKKNKNCTRRNIRKHNAHGPQLNLNLDSKIDENDAKKYPRLKGCGKSKSLDSSDMYLITHTLNDITPLPTSIEENVKSINEECKYETIENPKSQNSITSDNSNSHNNRPNKNAKEFTKLSFFTNSKTSTSRAKKRDIPVCDLCKCITLNSNSIGHTNIDHQEGYICSACLTSTATNTPTKKSKNLTRESKHSSSSEKSRSSSPHHCHERNASNTSEIEIGCLLNIIN